jgi:dihydrofolate synthase / folylpolyglutamate synthase
MGKFRTLQEAENALALYAPLAFASLGDNLTVDRMWPLLEALGNPQKNLRAVHLAGTSGKTSTAYYMAALLQKAGKKVGLTISPHTEKITERVQIDGQPLDDVSFCRYTEKCLRIVETLPVRPSYFEIMVALTLWVFSDLKVDYAVVETGLGGLHDGTNVFRRDDKVCILTDIGFDHMHVLGYTLPEIAFQKAGIIQQNNTVVMYRQPAEVQAVFDRAIAKNSSRAFIYDSSIIETEQFISGFPNYQKRNWTLALRAYDLLKKRDSLPKLSAEQLLSTQIAVPGRMELVRYGEKEIIFDGAHNQQKMHAFVSSLVGKYGNKKFPILLGLKKGKEYVDIIKELLPVTSLLIVTSFDIRQDTVITSQDPAVIAASAVKQSHSLPVIVEPDMKLACMRLLESKGDVAIVTGSFYMLSSAKRCFS